MSKLKVLDVKGSPAGEMEVADSLLETGRGASAVHDAVVNYLATIRAGTASTLSKGEVAGSNKKPWRQKGTGRARAGYRQSPVWRGGGAAFGPKPRTYGQKVNRKVARLAFRRAISEKIAADELIVIEALEMSAPKTKAFIELTKTLKINGAALFVVDAIEDNVKLSARNLKGIEVVRAQELDVYRLLKHNTVVVTRAGMDVVAKRLDGTLGEKK